MPRQGKVLSEAQFSSDVFNYTSVYTAILLTITVVGIPLEQMFCLSFLGHAGRRSPRRIGLVGEVVPGAQLTTEYRWQCSGAALRVSNYGIGIQGK